MQYLIAISLVVLIFVVLGTKRGRDYTATANLFYLNTKPSLEKNGFFEEAGWCTEQVDFIESLYYLREPVKSKAFAGLPKSTLRTWLPKNSVSMDDKQGAPHNSYCIAFEAMLLDGSAKGKLSLTMTARNGVQLKLLEHKEMTLAFAPLSFFTQANIELVLQRFRMDMESCDKGDEPNPMWMIYGIPNNRQSTCCTLPYIYPTQEKPGSKPMKQASKLFKGGYPVGAA